MTDSKHLPLIIITTRSKYLPTEQGNTGLFNEKMTEPAHSQDELLSIFDHSPSLYRVKSSLIFGHHCLEDKQLKEHNVRAKFIMALTKSVAACLSTADATSITEIIYILHGDDLGSKERFKIVENKQWIENLSQSSIFEKRHLSEYESDPNLSPGTSPLLPVRFVAFSHQSSTHAFMDQVLYDNKYTGNRLDCHIRELVNRSVEIPEKEWLADKTFDPISLPGGLPEFFFELHDYDFVTRSFDEYKQNQWAKLAKALKAVSKLSGHRIRIVPTSIKFIEATEKLSFYKALISTFFPTETENNTTRDTPFCPVLFIGVKDIMRIPPKDRILDGQHGQKIYLDPRYRFLDSSIWYRYVCTEGDFEKNLGEALRTFEWAFRHRLYDKNVCREYLELYNRLVLNSYLDNFGGGHGHADQVYPFTFHSESFIEHKAMPLAAQFTQKELHWNFLLVDDYANCILKEGNEIPTIDSAKDHPESKGIIIKNLIDQAPGQPATEEQPGQKSFQREFAQASSVSDALRTIESQSRELAFDIILLDYLFSLPEPGVSKGVEMLERMESGEITEGKGVSQKYWVHPITVFPEAMLSEFQEKSLQHFEKNWILARGADPINTPHLFRCSLYEFMKVQYERLMVDERRLWEFVGGISILEGEQSHKVSKAKAFSAFCQLIEQFSAIEGMAEGSAIRQSVYNLLNGKDRAGKELLDHLRQLLYLFAYTTGFDAQTMQHEYEAINALFKKHVDALQKEKTNISPSDAVAPQDLEEREKIAQAAENSMQKLAIGVYSIAEKYF